MAKGHPKLPQQPVNADLKVLTAKQVAFVTYYLECGSPRKAAEKAGYKHPRVDAQVLMQHPLILLEIKEANAILRAKRRKRLEESVELAETTLERVMRSGPAEDGKRRFQDHIEAARTTFELAGLINQHAQKKAPYYEDYSSRTEGELDYFVKFGYYPDDPRALEPGQSGAHRGTIEGGGRALCAPGAAPGDVPDPGHSQ